MARRTPAVAEQVKGPYIRTNAFIKARLIDFDTDSAVLEAQHKKWLAEKMAHVKKQSGFQMWLIGFASKIGDAKHNRNLSNNRMNSVLKFVGDIDDRAMNSLQTWEARGEEGYKAAESDNSADMRAVEVHIFIGSAPQPPPPDIKPTPRPVIPLPGGKRFTKWAVAAPGGAVSNVVPGVVIGFNIFVFKNEETGEQRAFIAPSAGFGASFSLKGLKGIKEIIQKVLTTPSGSPVEFTSLTSALPVTWEELEESLATVSSVGAGVFVGAQAAHISIDAPNVWRHTPSGIPIRKEVRLFEFNAVGKSYQLGAGGSAVTGPLIKVAE